MNYTPVVSVLVFATFRLLYWILSDEEVPGEDGFLFESKDEFNDKLLSSLNKL